LKTQNKFWLIIAAALSATVIALCTVGLVVWHALTSDHQQLLRGIVFENFAYFFSAGFILLVAFGFAADWIFRAYVIPINRLAEEIDLINTVNPELRVSVRGSFDVRRLAKIINQSAELVSRLRKSQAQNLKAAQSATENEKTILATLLSDLPQGILICNLDGRIVFYNRKVRQLLGQSESERAESGTNSSQWVGLGRSVYSFVDQSLVRNTLERIADKLTRDRGSASERFIIGTQSGNVLPAELLPVLDSQHHVAGFIIYIEDLTARIQQAEEQSKHLELWQHQLTQSISVIKTVAEILRDISFKSDTEYQQMVQVLSEQSDLAAHMWGQKGITDPLSGKAAWPLTAIGVEQWAKHAKERLNPDLQLELKIDPQAQAVHISIDIHHMTQAIVSVLDKVRKQYRIVKAQAHFYRQEAWLYADIVWKGPAINVNTLKQWKLQCCGVADNRTAIAIGDILVFHGARLWPHRRPDMPGSAGLRLLVPTLEDDGAAVNGRMTILPESRPEFYDFNLFQQAGQSPELDNRLLSDLTFTVFDTETTGLDPAGGDEIISIGALRIVNGRLLKEEQFNQLVDPKRHLPWESIKYHGIRPEMLVDQPTIEQVLPRFQHFAQETVLVGHNVAFDMRMLQVKEAVTGIQFINPVLDTMLLSSVVHPAQEDHSLGVAAQRLGVNIVGRHSAMGDALATAEIFLKLVPLLARNGVHTLFDAREASKTSYYARLKY
jgi:DNA polymerase-3 subunit epsilon